jgi:hypothetical protein
MGKMLLLLIFNGQHRKALEFASCCHKRRILELEEKLKVHKESVV